VVIVGVVVVLVVVRFAGSVNVPSFNQAWRGMQFNPHDDMHSYLVSMERMLQTGSVGLDAFNSRQMVNALGGEHFLNAMVVARLPWDHVHMLEAGIGLALLCMAVGGLGLRFGLGGSGAAVLAGVPLVVEWPIVNLSSMLTASVAMVLLVSGMLRGNVLWLAGLALGVVCTLKSTMIPAACVTVGVVYMLQAFIDRRWQPIFNGLLVGGVALLVMLPWMVWQWRSSGTLLYPMFGKGVHFEVYRELLSPFPMSMPAELWWRVMAGLLLPVGLLLVVGVLALWQAVRHRTSIPAKAGAIWDHHSIVLAVLAAWVVTWLVLLSATDMPDVSRYIASVRVVGFVVVLAFFWRLGVSTKSALWKWLGPVAFGVLVLWNFSDWEKFYFKHLPESLRSSFSGELKDWRAVQAGVLKMQHEVPAGERLVVYMATPAFLDFCRNRIEVMDWPGESSPPPGLPVWGGGEKIAEYLMGQGVRYFAYSYRTQAFFPREQFGLYVSPMYGRIISRQAAESFAFQDGLAELMGTRYRVYDDGVNVLLDLEKFR